LMNSSACTVCQEVGQSSSGMLRSPSEYQDCLVKDAGIISDQYCVEVEDDQQCHNQDMVLSLPEQLYMDHEQTVM
jgi:hypothetical protein